MASAVNVKPSTILKTGSYDEVVKCSVCGTEVSRVKKVIAKLPKNAQKITVKTTNKTVKYSKVKKATQKFTITTTVKDKAGLTFKKTSGNKKITVSKTGKVSVKKGTKKGTYKITVKVSAKETKLYKAATVTKTIKVVVK